MKLYQAIASAVVARRNCEESGNTEWFDKWTERLDAFEDYLPSGSGFDNGTKIDLDRTTADKIVLTTAYHNMDVNGYYVGWTEHVVTVRPTFQGITLSISGRDRNGFKEYAYEVFHYALDSQVEVSADNSVRVIPQS